MAHSYSSLKLWRTCPAQYRAKYIDKCVVSQDSPALRRGREVHEQLDAALQGRSAVPDAYARYAPLVQTLRAKGARPEASYGMTADGTPCGFDDPKAWLRGRIDVEMVSGDNALLLDWKTGQYRVDEFQADVYAALLRAIHPGLTIEFSFVYLDVGRTATCTPDKDALRRVQAIAEACESDTMHQPRPCWACRFCPVRTCIHNGE